MSPANGRLRSRAWAFQMGRSQMTESGSTATPIKKNYFSGVPGVHYPPWLRRARGRRVGGGVGCTLRLTIARGDLPKGVDWEPEGGFSGFFFLRYSNKRFL